MFEWLSYLLVLLVISLAILCPILLFVKALIWIGRLIFKPSEKQKKKNNLNSIPIQSMPPAPPNPPAIPDPPSQVIYQNPYELEMEYKVYNRMYRELSAALRQKKWVMTELEDIESVKRGKVINEFKHDIYLQEGQRKKEEAELQHKIKILELERQLHLQQAEPDIKKDLSEEKRESEFKILQHQVNTVYTILQLEKAIKDHEDYLGRGAVNKQNKKTNHKPKSEFERVKEKELAILDIEKEKLDKLEELKKLKFDSGATAEEATRYVNELRAMLNKREFFNN